MIKQDNNIFELHTINSSLVLEAAQNGQLLMLFYGKRISGDSSALCYHQEYATGNTIVYEDDDPSFAPENYCFAFAGNGKGDVRESIFEISDSKGNKTFDFKYDGFEIAKEKPALGKLPSSYGESETLVLIMKDSFQSLTAKLYFTVFEEEDVITRSVELINESEEPVTVEKLLSNLLDFDRDDFTLTHFHGSWASEMNEENTPVSSAAITLETRTGTSSSRCNPLFLLKANDCALNHGEVYAFNLVYSGDHYASIQSDHFGRTRVVSGMSPFNFSYKLGAGESLYSPESVMAYSDAGLNGITDAMHRFVNNHIVRGEWKGKERPVLINSWEAAYFNFTEGSLLRLAKEAKDCGIELFVMDDGWFGKRDDDKKSLGDWVVNTKKLPGGLKGFADKLKSLGLKFGIWVEPEMVNEDSDLYRAHPDWAITASGGAAHSKGRNQMILDLSNPEVCEFIIDSMTDVFSSADISYVKWDMNRIFSDYYSAYLRERSGELIYRYYEGFYSILRTLTKRFPDILFEGCASGGNRFDLGMLCFFHQIWASDNTDAVCRKHMQNSYYYGYPQSVISCHVSDVPNHQTLRRTPIESRFNVASFGVLGYECNLCDMSKEDKEAVKNQVELYKKYRSILQFGRLYRTEYGDFAAVSEDKKTAIGMHLEEMVTPNKPYKRFKAAGLLEEQVYHFENVQFPIDIRDFGGLINAVAPIHVKPDGLIHGVISNFVKFSTEKEDICCTGSVLMHAGVPLTPAFAGNGYNEKVRMQNDYSSRLYIMEAEDAHE